LTPFTQGLYVSAVGIVVLFITATIFYFLLVGLQRLFPEKEERPEPVEPASRVVAAAETSLPDEEIAAVIAIAIQNSRRLTESGLGTALQQGRSGWWSAHLLAAREGTRKK